MPSIIPPFDHRSIVGGFIARLFDNLPKPFNPSPKAVSALVLTPNSSGNYKYMSIADGSLWFHNSPYDTPEYTPEKGRSLGSYTIDALAASLDSLGCGYYGTSLGKQDGTNSVLLLGFKDFLLDHTNIIELQIATSKLWKFLYPIAQVLYTAEQDSQTAENELYMPFATGFWLDFWGDWFKLPRLPGMDDLGYVSYLMRNLRTPKSNNMAIEDILTAKYNVPAQVTDSGYKQFTATLDASVISISSSDIAPLINQVKAAGTKWLLAYYSKNMENFNAYFYDKHGGQDFKTSDAVSLKLAQFEEKYGHSPISGFLFNNDTLNNGLPTGQTRDLKDTLSLMTYSISVTDTKRAQSGLDTFTIPSITWRPSETWTRKQETLVGVTTGALEGKYGYNTETGFMFGTGTFGNDSTGGGRRIKDTFTMFYS